MSENKPVASDTMIALMRYAKNPKTQEFTFEGAREALGALYSYHMRLRDILHVVTRTYLEMMDIREFEMPYRGDKFTVTFNLMLAPIDNNSYKIFKGEGLNDESQMTTKDFYLEMLKKMMSDIMLARCDWCRDQLGLFPKIET